MKPQAPGRGAFERHLTGHVSNRKLRMEVFCTTIPIDLNPSVCRARFAASQVNAGQDYGRQESQPFEQTTEVVAGGSEHSVGGIALGSGEVVS
jgi:hypothetical protein